MESVEKFLIGGAALVVLSVISSKASGRLGVPSLLAFLGVGMLAGQSGVQFDDPSYAQIFGTMALIYILFSGGMDTRFEEIKPVLYSGLILSSLGVLLTCVLTGWFATTFFEFNWLQGLLLGAIISCTDAAAVFTVLRGKGVNLKGSIQPLLELESGSNDPMALLLTVELLRMMANNETSLWKIVPHFFQEMAVGGILGFLAGKGIAIFINRIKLEFEGLYPVVTLALVILVYGVTQYLGGNGFLSVYLAGLILGNENFIHKKSLIIFHDGIAWLMQIAMFLILGFLTSPAKLIPVAGMGMAIALFLMFFARPLAVFLSLIGTRFNKREKGMIAWVGLKGSVPIVLATYCLTSGVDKADLIFHLVFFIVLSSVLFQGMSVPFVAKLLRVESTNKSKFRYPIEFVPNGSTKSELTELEVSPHAFAVGKSLIELKLPKDVLVVLIHRRGNVIIPNGGTLLHAEDNMLVLADYENFGRVKNLVQKKS